MAPPNEDMARARENIEKDQYSLQLGSAGAESDSFEYILLFALYM
jgi:hypothetical protein